VSGFTLHVRRKETFEVEQRIAEANRPADPPAQPPVVPSGDRMPPAIAE
jgi:hypothetical protein